MRKALVVGLDYYAELPGLYGCVNDAQSVATLLRNHGDEHGEPNFGVKLITASSVVTAISKDALREHVQALFAEKREIALLYFAGHGHKESTGSYLCGSDSRSGHDGLSLSDVLKFADDSNSINKIIVLDSCHSGNAGSSSRSGLTELSDGTTILTASTAEQYASEANGSGLFTTLFVDALNGAAANLVGDITPGSVYAHIDQSLGEWGQRPVFKTNVETFVSLRKVSPAITRAELRRLSEFFPAPGFLFPLDPSFEPELTGRPEGAALPDPINTAKFAVLQRYNRVNLLKPVGAPHMWHAAMEKKPCQLTVLGEHYRRLVQQGRI
jgi:hypothetical protein